MSPAGKLLGIDYGTVRIGLSVSNPEQTMAFPLSTRIRRDRASDEKFFRELLVEERISGLVVGLPLHAWGEDSPMAIEAREFGQWLGALSQLSVALWDERFTTSGAEALLWQAGLTHKKRQAKRDMLAAQLMLQSYLDSRIRAT